MDEIEKRLRETSDNCFTAYEVWRKDMKDATARTTLQEAIHEVRKVASRLEIELAVSERDEMRQKPIPIPPHRDAHRRNSQNDDDGDGNGNILSGNTDHQSGPPPRHQGGGQHGGGGSHHQRRRPQRRAEGGQGHGG